MGGGGINTVNQRTKQALFIHNYSTPLRWHTSMRTSLQGFKSFCCIQSPESVPEQIFILVVFLLNNEVCMGVPSIFVINTSLHLGAFIFLNCFSASYSFVMYVKWCLVSTWCKSILCPLAGVRLIFRKYQFVKFFKMHNIYFGWQRLCCASIPFEIAA
jgi:hypothetical protein